MRLIDADAFANFLKNIIKTQKYDALKVNGDTLTVGDVLESVIAELDGTSLDGFKNNPTIEPQRIKGRWVRKESDLSWWYECSECGDSPLFDPYEHEVRSPFCPWCGARMEEEEDG